MLAIERLSVSFHRYAGLLHRTRIAALRDVSLSVASGEVLGIVGGSGAGKSLLAHAILGLLPPNAEQGGRILFEGTPLDAGRLSRLRGRRIALVPQSIAHLDPLARIVRQAAWAAERAGTPRRESAARAGEALERLGLDAEAGRAFPHELSGGMARRALMAIATIGNAGLIVADEPTTGLDPDNVAAIMARLRGLADRGKAVLVITHDLAALLPVADRVTILDDGASVETAAAAAFSGSGRALATDCARALWRALPQNEFIGSATPLAALETVSTCRAGRSGGSFRAPVRRRSWPYRRISAATASCRSPTIPRRLSAAECPNSPLAPMLEVRRVSFAYGAGDAVFRDVSLTIAPGEVVGLSGPSGSGKSTLARLLCGYLAPRSGRVLLDGAPLPSAGFCPVQMLFQTAELAVDPRWTIRRILTEAHDPPASLLAAFGVRDDWLGRHPHELSGGELQRVAIVRALDERVRFIVADEISGMLDPLSQADIWRGLLAFAAARRVGMLVVAHDEALMARLATRRLTWVTLEDAHVGG